MVYGNLQEFPINTAPKVLAMTPGKKGNKMRLARARVWSAQQ